MGRAEQEGDDGLNLSNGPNKWERKQAAASRGASSEQSTSRSTDQKISQYDSKPSSAVAERARTEEDDASSNSSDSDTSSKYDPIQANDSVQPLSRTDENYPKPEALPWYKKYKVIIIATVFIIVTWIAVLVPVVLTRKNKGNDEAIETVPVAPEELSVPKDPEKEAAFAERLAPITPGGIDTLNDPQTAHHRAWQWLVYEDGMKLGPDKDHLHQRYVLMVIYLSLGGDWNAVQGRLEWGSPAHECEWDGVVCKDEEELVAELGKPITDLEAGERDGVIKQKMDTPFRVVNRLSLRQRLVDGQIPDDISSLYYLQHLNLENNMMMGALPKSVYGLFNLQALSLEQNELTNVDAIGDYKHLEQLALSMNAFDGSLPESFGNLNKLRKLYLHNNAFTGQVFDYLEGFKSLELIDIEFNRFEGTLPASIGNLTKLESLFIGHNEFHGKIPEEISSCEQLKEISIESCSEMDGPIPPSLGQLSQLEFLKLDTCSFGGTLPPTLGNLDKLRFMDVSSNNLQGNVPLELGNAKSLTTLALGFNDFDGNIPSELGSLTKLEELNLKNTEMSGAMPEEICELREQGILTDLCAPDGVECDCCTYC